MAFVTRIRLAWPPGLDGLGVAFEAAFREAIAEASRRAHSPRRFQSRTGRYVASLAASVTRAGNVLIGRVASSDPKALALEKGGRAPARRIEVRQGRALAFTVGGQPIFARYADIPPVIHPPKPNLVPSMQAGLRPFRAQVRDTLEKLGR